jgi:hypothetical protein
MRTRHTFDIWNYIIDIHFQVENLVGFLGNSHWDIILQEHIHL